MTDDYKSRRRLEPSSPTPDVPSPPPQRDAQRSMDIALIEIAKIQEGNEYIKRDLGEVRNDMKDVRDRTARLEVKVDHLPTKGFIVTAIVIALTIIGGIVTIAPKLQNLIGSGQPNVQAPLK